MSPQGDRNFTMPQYKRQRTTKRPVNKESYIINHTVSTTAQDDNIIHTATVAETFTGAYIDGVFSVGATATGDLAWALVVVGESRSTSTLNMADGSSIYEPEQEVLASGVVKCLGTDTNIYGLTLGGGPIRVKTSRKLKTGDKVVFCIRSNTTTGKEMIINITSFYKQ